MDKKEFIDKLKLKIITYNTSVSSYVLPNIAKVITILIVSKVKLNVMNYNENQ